MKKIIIILCLVLTSATVKAQKADISVEEIQLTLELPSYLKNVKTFTYEIQDDGEYWNYTTSPESYPKEEYPNLTSLTSGVTIDGLEMVDENPDLKILVGFLGNQLIVNNSLISMKGTYSIMLLDKENKLVHSKTNSVTLNQVANPKKFPMGNRNQRNQTKARMLTIYTQDYLDGLSYLFNETSTQKLPFGLFKKTKGGIAEDFNTESRSLIQGVSKNPLDITALDKSIAYWKSQIDVDFGKKVKDKVKNKVLYVNLTTASILKNDFDKAKLYHETVKNNSGFFDLWTVNYDNVFKMIDALELLKNQDLVTIIPLSNTVYYFTIDGGGTYSYKDKEIQFSKIEIERFVPKKESGMASLNTVEKPRIFIYEDGVKTLRHFGSEKNNIVTTDGREIIFKKDKGAFKPYFKTEDGEFVLFESN